MILSINRRVSSLWATTLLAFVMVLGLAACSNDTQSTPTVGQTETGSPSTASAEPTIVNIVATTGIVADWVENIGGERVEVFSLVPNGSDPHSFQPGAQDVARVADADLVLTVGLGLEESWLRELLQNAAQDPATIIELADSIEPIEFAESHVEVVELIEGLNHIAHEVEEGEIGPEEGLEEIRELLESTEGEEEGENHGDEDDLPAMAMAIVQDADDGRMEAGEAIEAIEALISEGEQEHEGHGHGIEDPHFWFDPLRVKLVVDDIASRLSALDPGSSDAYSTNAAAYNTQLDELHAWTEGQVRTVPEERRLLVTSHDSLGYFANLYGFEVVGVILSGTTEVDPSPKDLANLVEEVTENNVPAVFGETTVSERLANAVATESGATLVRLYSGSLGGGDTDAGTYIGMVRTNVERIVEALR